MIGGAVNSGVTGITGAITDDKDINAGMQIVGSAAGTTTDILTGNIPGAVMNGIDLITDITGAASNSNKTQPRFNFAMGGDMNDPLSGNMDMTTFDGGGTHEQNPNGGIPIGNNKSVEEGETLSNGKVYSDRLVINKQLAKEFQLPARVVGKTFAEASKLYNNSERDNDVFYKTTSKKELENLFNAQEAFKAVEQPPQPMRPPQPMEQMELGGEKYTLAQGAPNVLDALGYYGVADVVKPGENKKDSKASKNGGMNSSVLRYAPLVGDAINTGVILNNKPVRKDLKMFNTNNDFDANLIDRNAIRNEINSQAGSTRSAIKNVSGGNAGNLASNLQGIDINSKKAISQAMLQSDSLDAQELARIQAMNYQQAARNAQSEMQVANMNDADKAAYYQALIDQISTGTQNIGNVGTDNLNRQLANQLPVGYKVDKYGNMYYDPSSTNVISQNNGSK